MTPVRVLGVAMLAGAVILAATLGVAAVFIIGALIIVGAGLLVTPRCAEPRPGYIESADVDHGYRYRTPSADVFAAPTAWLVEFEIWHIDLTRTISLQSIEMSLNRIIAGRNALRWDSDIRHVIHYRVQVLASNHDVAIRQIERAADRERLNGLILRNLSARPGTINTNNRSVTR